MGEIQGIARHHSVRRPRHRRQGRNDQGDYRESEPARVPGRRAAVSVRAREDADVHPALRPAVSGRRRSRHLRPQLVQPGRRRIRDGILQRRGASALSRPLPAGRKMDRRSRHHPDQGVAGGRTGRAGSALRGPNKRSGPAMEAEPDGPGVVRALVRLLQGTRPHARRDRQQGRALAHRAFGRQAAGAPQLHRAHPVADPLQEGAACEGRAAEALDQRQVRRRRGTEGS